MNGQMRRQSLWRTAGNLTEEKWLRLWHEALADGGTRTPGFTSAARIQRNRLIAGYRCWIQFDWVRFRWPALPAGTIRVEADVEGGCNPTEVWGSRCVWDSAAWRGGPDKPRRWRKLGDWKAHRTGDWYGVDPREQYPPSADFPTGEVVIRTTAWRGLRAITG